MQLTADRQNAALDALLVLLRADARSFAAQCRRLVELDELSALEGASSGVRQFLVMELAGTCRTGQQSAGSRLVEADRLVHGLPLLLDGLEAGRVLVGQARLVLSETSACNAALLPRIDAVVTPQIGESSSSDLRRLVRRTVLELEDAQEAADRLASARTARRVRIRPGHDGMGVLTALLTAEQLARFQADQARLVAAERVADRDAGIVRTDDQRSADLLAALPGRVLAGMPATGRSDAPPAGIVFNVHVPVATVLDRGRSPGFVDGFGEISAEHVLLLRPAASLRPVYVDADTGQPLHIGDVVRPARAGVDSGGGDDSARQRVLALLRPVVHVDRAEDKHDPSAALARLVDARDRWCRGPGCSSRRCQRDHLVPYPQGPTAVGNLGLKSERCHAAKHNGWTMVRHPDGGVTWTSPLGRTYRRPSPHVPPTPPRPTPLPRPAISMPEQPSDESEPPTPSSLPPPVHVPLPEQPPF